MKNFVVTQTDDHALRSRYVMQMQNEEGEVLTSCSLNLVKTAFGNEFVKTLCFSAVATPMQHRRNGYVREIFDKAWQLGIEQGAVISLLHPFSFSYYEKFGYGKVADHRMVRCPIRLLDSVPRCCNLKKLEDTPKDWEELYCAHNEFCRGRQLMMQHSDPKFFKSKEIWAFRENGKITGYISFSSTKRLEINHYEDGLLTVNNIAYLTPTALKSLLGFIRMFEGELDFVEFANIAMCPEIELYIHHDTHTHFRLLPDLMVRVLDSEKILKAYNYPKEKGAFSITVNDKLSTVNGKFSVEYGDGTCEVKRLDDSAVTDITVNASMFSRLIYGYDGLTCEQAKFCEGISIDGNAEDFFRAFTKRPCGTFEHF